MATSVIEAVQDLYAGLTAWSGQPSALWLGPAWPRNAAGQLVSLPVFRMLHTGTRFEKTFPHSALEHWGFRFELFAVSAQECIRHHDRILYNGGLPSAGTGFYFPSSVAMPTNYVFKHFAVTAPYQIEVLDGQFSPNGSLLTRLSWEQDLFVHRTSFA